VGRLQLAVKSSLRIYGEVVEEQLLQKKTFSIMECGVDVEPDDPVRLSGDTEMHKSTAQEFYVCMGIRACDLLL
jgi:hypothetical protein